MLKSAEPVEATAVLEGPVMEVDLDDVRYHPVVRSQIRLPTPAIRMAFDV